MAQCTIQHSKKGAVLSAKVQHTIQLSTYKGAP